MALSMIQTRPVDSHGVYIAGAAFKWKMVVEMMLPEDGASLWDVALWNSGEWSTYQWVDITDRVRGQTKFRGSDDPANGQPTTGYATITLENLDDLYNPWLPTEVAAYYRPGTIIRVGCIKEGEDDWIPQFCGAVESWLQKTTGLMADNEIEITLQETVGLLGAIDKNALGSLVGTGETSGLRVQRLLYAALWQYGFYDEAQATTTLQSTDMNANRLAELKVTAESAYTYFRAHRSGMAMLEPQESDDNPTYDPPNAARWDAAVWNVSQWTDTASQAWYQIRAASYYYSAIDLRPDSAGLVLPDFNGRYQCRLVYDADTLVGANDTDVVANDIRLANVGGTQQVAQDTVSMGHYGQKTYARSDLITQQQSDVLAIAQRIRDRRSEKVLRVEEVTLSSLQPGNLPGMFVIDIGDAVTVTLPNYYSFTGQVKSLTHNITPLDGSDVQWTIQVGLETDSEIIEPAVIGGGI